ncbi:MAG: hypothetical protein RO009_01240 [Pseudorhodoplanes sp.]|jgi:pyridoxal/pyridoxine/pyridoxamine kinase|nr:hypothetical protein [Pseudorhodoplanes sp.]
MSIISIQGQVLHGRVGNSAAVLPMEVHGLNVAVISFDVAGTAAFFGMKAELQNVYQRVAKIERTPATCECRGTIRAPG